MTHVRKTDGFIDVTITFDDESGCVLVELISMGPDPAMLGLFKDEGKCIAESLFCPKPDKSVRSYINAGFKSSGVGITDFRIQTVSNHDNIGVSETTIDIFGFKFFIKI